MKYIGSGVFNPPAGLGGEHGWFTANGQTKFGPLPKRQAPAEPTWPPRKLERTHLTAYPNWINKKAE